MDYELAFALRKRAVDAIEESNTILNVAENLLKQGNQREAARLRNEARIKRNESILLMDQASGVEQGRSNVLQFGRKETSAESAKDTSESVGSSTEKRAGHRRFRMG
jgi:hypothetical protein